DLVVTGPPIAANHDLQRDRPIASIAIGMRRHGMCADRNAIALEYDAPLGADARDLKPARSRRRGMQGEGLARLHAQSVRVAGDHQTTGSPSGRTDGCCSRSSCVTSLVTSAQS